MPLKAKYIIVPILFFIQSCITLASTCIKVDQSNISTLLHTMKPVHTLISDGEITPITNSGSYQLVENITQSELLINADNVTLDLNGFTIKNDRNDSPCILLFQNKKNIIIKNGSVDGNNNSVGIFLVGGNKNISIENMSISNCSTGAALLGDTDQKISCCKTKNCSINNCIIAVLMSYAEGCIFKRVEASCCTRNGFELEGCNDNTFMQCKAIGIGPSTKTGNAFGFTSVAGENNLFYECMAEDIYKEQSNWCTKAMGFKFGFLGDTPETKSKIIKCCTDSILSSEFGNAFGIHLEMKLLDTMSQVTTENYGNNPIRDVDWSAQGKYLAITNDLNGFKIIQFEEEAPSGRQLIELWTDENLNNKTITSIAWSPSGKYLAIGTQANASGPELYILRFNTMTLELLDEETTENNINKIKWTHDGKYILVSTNNDALLLYYLFAGESLHLIDTQKIGTNNESQLLAISADDKLVALGLSEGSKNFEISKIIKNYRIQKKIDEKTLLTPTSADWNPNTCCETYYLAIVGSSENNTIEIWKYEINKNNLTLLIEHKFSDSLTTVKWSPDGKYIAVAGDDIQEVGIFRFDPQIQALFPVFDSPYTTSVTEINNLDWSDCGRYLAISGSPNSLEIVKLANCVTKCVIQNNKIANVTGGLCGIGLFGAACCNLIDKNLLSGSCINTSKNVFNTFLSSKGTLTMCRPNPLDNLEFDTFCC